MISYENLDIAVPILFAFVIVYLLVFVFLVKITGYIAQKRTQKVTERRAFWSHFPKYAPTDLADYLAFMEKYYPEERLITLSLRNENVKVTEIILEPWGPVNAFPFGANYHFVISLKSELPDEPVSFPEQIVCTPEWSKQYILTVIGEFELKDQSLTLRAQNVVGRKSIFRQDGTAIDVY